MHIVYNINYPVCESAAASDTIALEARQFSLNHQYT